MVRSLRLALTLCLTSVCLAGSASAAPPFGPYSYLIGGDSEIWYPDGAAEFCEPDAPPGASSCLDTTAATDGTGAVSGTGVWHANLPGEADGDVPFVITGKLAGSTRDPRPKLVAQFDGALTFHILGQGILAAVTGTGNFSCRNPLPHAAKFQCPGHAKLCATLLGRRRCFGAGRVRIDLGAAGGPWTLETDLMTDPNTNAISGDAKATLANAASQDFVAKGKYSPKSDLSKLVLTPLDPASKNKVSFADSYGGPYMISPSKKIKFKVAGVSGVYPIPAPPP